mgnify:CR=1 FL=1
MSISRETSPEYIAISISGEPTQAVPVVAASEDASSSASNKISPNGLDVSRSLKDKNNDISLIKLNELRISLSAA